MADTSANGLLDYTNIDFDKISDVIQEWEKIINIFDGEWIRANDNEGYKALKEAFLDSGFISSYDENINKLVTALKTSVATLKAVLKNMGMIDDSVSDDMPDPRDDSRKQDPPEEEFIDNAKEQFESYDKMSMNDLSKIAAELNNLSNSQNKTFEELLNNEEYSDNIRELLLVSPNVSSDLKQLVTAGSSKVTQSVIRDIFNGNQMEIVGLNDNTALTLKTYLTYIAENNNLILEALINDEKNFPLLKEALQRFSPVTDVFKDLDDNTIKDQFIKIYDGDGIDKFDSLTVSLIRQHANSISQNKNISVETVFESESLAQELKELGKFSVFVSNLSGYSSSSVAKILNGLIK